jgi:hypothetical protein
MEGALGRALGYHLPNTNQRTGVAISFDQLFTRPWFGVAFCTAVAIGTVIVVEIINAFN